MEFTTAIINVLQTSRKREVKEEIKLIESMGYKVEKGNFKNMDGLEVYNPTTNKYFYMNSRYSYKNGKGGYVYRLVYASYYSYTNSSEFDTLAELRDTFNFEDFLNTPYNKAYNDVKYYNTRISKSYETYQSLKHERWNVEYHEKEIEKAKAELEKQIASLQKSILYHTEQLAKSKQDLNNFKKEVGLVK